MASAGGGWPPRRRKGGSMDAPAPGREVSDDRASLSCFLRALSPARRLLRLPRDLRERTVAWVDRYLEAPVPWGGGENRAACGRRRHARSEPCRDGRRLWGRRRG